MSSSDNGTFVSIELNAAGLLALQSAIGGDFVIGGHLEAASEVPEPSAALLLIVGLAGIAVAMSRRRLLN